MRFSGLCARPHPSSPDGEGDRDKVIVALAAVNPVVYEQRARAMALCSVMGLSMRASNSRRRCVRPDFWDNHLTSGIPGLLRCWCQLVAGLVLQANQRTCKGWPTASAACEVLHLLFIFACPHVCDPCRSSSSAPLGIGLLAGADRGKKKEGLECTKRRERDEKGEDTRAGHAQEMPTPLVKRSAGRLLSVGTDPPACPGVHFVHTGCMGNCASRVVFNSFRQGPRIDVFQKQLRNR